MVQGIFLRVRDFLFLSGSVIGFIRRRRSRQPMKTGAARAMSEATHESAKRDEICNG